MAPEMSISYQRRVVFLSLVITLMACENEATRSQRRAVERLQLEIEQRSAVMDDSLRAWQDSLKIYPDSR